MAIVMAMEEVEVEAKIVQNLVRFQPIKLVSGPTMSEFPASSIEWNMMKQLMKGNTNLRISGLDKDD
uniref:Uncharacterized protein n=1 Tax=Manihot esculenta TaxID=3983 RepID=A0A2C9W276_MANES